MLDILKKRSKETNKYDYGNVLIFAGKNEMLGASALASNAALRCGSGLVSICIEERYSDYELFTPILDNSILRSPLFPLEVIKRNYKDIFKENKINNYDSILIGPGLGIRNYGKKTINKLLLNYKHRLILDADAINIIAKNEKLKYLLFNISKYNNEIDVVLTPHEREAARLFSDNYLEEIKKKVENEPKLSVILKSDITMVFSKSIYDLNISDEILKLNEDKLIEINKEYIKIDLGNPGMATAGSGDVLAGILVSFLGEKSPIKLSILEGMVCAVITHSKAGGYAESEVGERSLIASDIIKNIYKCFIK